MGKAQPVESPVLTPHGWRAIGELACGDAVIGSDGRPTEVMGVFPQGRRHLYKIGFSDGTAARSCAEHLWTVTWRPNHRNELPVTQTHPLQALVGRGLRVCRADGRWERRFAVPLVSPVHFEQQSSHLPLDPYLLGLLLGDGSLSQQQVLFSTADAELLAAIRMVLPSGVSLRETGYCGWRLTIGNCGRGDNAVLSSLRQLGLMGHRSESKFIPTIYQMANPLDRLAMVQGLLDTDGHVESANNNVESRTSSTTRRQFHCINTLTGRDRHPTCSHYRAFAVSSHHGAHAIWRAAIPFTEKSELLPPT